MNLRLAPLVTVGLSSLLLFALQPMAARAILPQFGGGASVWTAAMLLFQGLLLAGYLYAHALVRLPLRLQIKLHLALALLALTFLPPLPVAPERLSDWPAVDVLVSLLSGAGWPFLLLSSTAPLLMAWQSRVVAEARMWRLYALSNGGSLLGLLAYPFLLEPWLDLDQQAWLWTGFYVAFLLALAATALGMLRWEKPRTGAAPAAGDGPGETSGDAGPVASEAASGERQGGAAAPVLLWLGLSCLGSVLLLAVTNQVCQEIAVVPLLWVLPLAVYLLSWVLVFERPMASRRVPEISFRFVVFAAMVAVLKPQSLPLPLQAATWICTLFCACLICHGELARLRPRAERLTLFTLCIAAGGALGGVLVSLVAPRIFQGWWELYLALAVVPLVPYMAADGLSADTRRRPRTAWIVSLALFAALGRDVVENQEDLAVARSFFGLLRVSEFMDPDLGLARSLVHGRTVHGIQYLGPETRRWPSSYYDRQSGLGIALRRHPRRLEQKPLRVCVVGLGTGTVATYAREGDRFVFVEIDPQVERLARSHFTYLADAEGEVDVRLGDGRRVLSDLLRAGERFDVVVVDAFTSDAIPMHLLTREAVALYRDLLRDEHGVVALHVSNQHLRLLSLTRSLVREAGCDGWYVSQTDERPGVVSSTWALLTGPSWQDDTELQQHAKPLKPSRRPAWTDRYGSLLPYLRWE